MSTNLTPQQVRAVRAARRTLALEEGDTAPFESDAYWRGAFRQALAMVAEAFPEDEL